MQLSKRLQAVAAMVTPGSRLADIGTDHGYVPIYLAEQGIISAAIAMDVNQGPLSRAREHIASHQLDAYIETRLSDGLTALGEGEADSLLIAGMGGGLTIRILSEGMPLLSGFSEVILEPQSDVDRVRLWLFHNGFLIADEDFVEEDGKYYPIIRAVHGTQEKEPSAWELLYGPLLLAEKHPVLGKFLLREDSLVSGLIRQLEGVPSEKARIRLQEMEKKEEWIRRALVYYQ
ncbi:MAG: tRNA (adenine(22)-N(1))-methyltransferase [Fusicatenibacter sp.]|nr:class I SAM-dependent methyltransferase [Fusicatenibacter sp.]